MVGLTEQANSMQCCNPEIDLKISQMVSEIERLRAELAEAKAATDAAVMAERERCAQIADDEDGVFEDYGMDANNAVVQRTCQRIAAAIRGDMK